MTKSKSLVVAARVALCLVLPLALRAQEVPAHTSESRLFVNGHEINGKLLEAQGKHFVAAEDLAQTLRGTIGYSDGQLVLTFPPPDLVSAAASVSGTVRGTLTFYFNSNYGNKPDAGSPVLLVKGHAEIPETSVFFPLADKDGFVVGTKYAIIKSTVADSNGNFEITDVPVGQYTIITQSKHVGDLNHRDISGKVVCRDVDVKAGKIADESWDFGMSKVP